MGQKWACIGHSRTMSGGKWRFTGHLRRVIGQKWACIGHSRTMSGGKWRLTGYLRSLIGEKWRRTAHLRTRIREQWALIGRRRTVIGCRSTLIGDRRTVIGDRRTVIGRRRTVIGCRNTLIGHRGTVIGDRRTVIGRRSTLIGCRNTLIGHRRARIVRRTTLIGHRRTLIGAKWTRTAYLTINTRSTSHQANRAVALSTEGYSHAEAQHRCPGTAVRRAPARRPSAARQHHRLYDGSSHRPYPTRCAREVGRATRRGVAGAGLCLRQRLVSNSGQRDRRVSASAFSVATAQRFVHRGRRLHELARQSRTIADAHA